tara:strand:- start:432 stop:980 length:549 start_codon:yes stop_codon:yes gene_type:complete
MTDESQNVTDSSNECEQNFSLEDISLEGQIHELSQKLDELKESNDHNVDATQRAQAELANYRKRADEERITHQQYANSRLIIRLLPIVDELEMALNLCEDNNANGSWIDGVRLIHRKVTQLLESEGLDKIESVGQAFDPVQHEAVSTAESDEVETGYIMEVLRNGYRLHDRIIQPAQVVVAR